MNQKLDALTFYFFDLRAVCSVVHIKLTVSVIPPRGETALLLQKHSEFYSLVELHSGLKNSRFLL